MPPFFTLKCYNYNFINQLYKTLNIKYKAPINIEQYFRKKQLKKL